MIESVFSQKISEYNPANALEQENILQELMHLFVLAGLSKTGFFHHAQFHGGTCLRVVHGMKRFSEDLDFVLKKPDLQFDWAKYLKSIQKDARHEGFQFEITDRSHLIGAVRKAFQPSAHDVISHRPSDKIRQHHPFCELFGKHYHNSWDRCTEDFPDTDFLGSGFSREGSQPQ